MIQNNYYGALQQPIQHRFNAYSTSREVIEGIDLKGRVAIVTGGNAGIGLETARTLAEAGATVIVAARDTTKAKKNLTGIANIEIEALDFMQPASIDSFAQKFLASNRPLHLLINNAGIMWVPFRTDERGIESQLATNYLGQFQLTARLWPALKQAKGARVVNVSSLGHHLSPFHFDDPNFENREYDSLSAYGQSKTASNLFALELDERGKAFDVRAFSLHPGSIAGTELAREATPEQFQKLGFLDENGNLRAELMASLKTIPQGAATSIWVASSPELNGIGGVYCENCNIAEQLSEAEIGLPQSQLHQSGVRGFSLDEAAAKRLWSLSEELTGIPFEVR